jgi:hypothetical protein
MTEQTRIGTIFRSNIGDALFNTLLRICPEGQIGGQGHAFHITLPSHDPRIGQLMGALATSGLRPWRDVSRPMDKQKEFGFELDRVYEAADLVECDFLELRPPTAARCHGATERGGKEGKGWLIVREGLLPEGRHDFLYGMFTWHFVPERVKKILESGDLRGLIFKPTHFSPLDMTVEDTDEKITRRHGTPFWEIDSNFTMPKLSPRMDIADSSGNSVDRGERYSNGFIRREDSFIHPELHYLKSDLKKLEPFDLARTYEVFGTREGRHGRDQEYQPYDQPLIASKRFYQFCVEHGLKAGWVPVRVDE